jgi:hypothetical protein
MLQPLYTFDMMDFWLTQTGYSLFRCPTQLGFQPPLHPHFGGRTLRCRENIPGPLDNPQSYGDRLGDFRYRRVQGALLGGFGLRRSRYNGAMY